MSRTTAARISALAGGLAAAAGTLLAWVRITASSGPASVAGLRVPFSSQSDAAVGTAHWTGVVALAASLVVVAAAAGVWRAPSRDRAAAALAASAGVVALVAAGGAFLLRGDIAEQASGPFLAGLHQVQRFGASVGVPVDVDVSAGLGLYETGLGGALAAGGGIVALGLRRAGGAPRQSR